MTDIIEDSERFEIRIEFQPDSGDPARVFAAMSGLIEAIQTLDRDLLSQFGVDLQSELYLEDVAKGSLRAFFRNLVKDSPDEALKSFEAKRIIGHFLLKAKYAFLKWAEDHEELESPDQLESLEAELLEAARETEVLRIPAYQSIRRDRLISVLGDINDATRHLEDGDRASYLSTAGNAAIRGNLAVSDDTIREILTRDVKESESDQTLLVKKPDYIGRSKWSFRYQAHVIEARILDEDWLGQFHSQQIKLQPGDGLRVRLREVFYYGNFGEIVSATYEVLAVLDVVHPIGEQDALL